MHHKSLFRVLSVLAAMISAFLVFMAIFSLLNGEHSGVSLSFLIPAAGGLIFLGTMLFLTRKDGNPYLTNREGFLFVTFSWLLASLMGCLPFWISGYIPSFVDAFFETMSGFTTTGASILKNIEVLPKSLLLWRATTHWLGGMGIVVLTVAIFPLLGFGGLRLMEAESPGPSVDKITPRVSGTAKIFWFIYLGLTLAEILLLLLGGMPLFDSVCHAFATMATGGFGVKNTSLGFYNSGYIDVVITVFMLLAGMNFTLHFRVLSGKTKSVLKDRELRLYMGIFALSTLFIAFNLYGHGIFESLGKALRYAGFQSSSILTTTGFATADFAAWPFASQALLFFLMFIGGCAGSTAGGIKVIRIFTLAKMAFTEMRYLMNPKGVYAIFVNGKSLRKNVVYDTAALVFLYFALMIVSFVVVGLGGYDITTSVTATLANLGNIGPGFALVGPTANYSFFPWWIKLWLSFIMLVGRLEVYTVLVLFTRRFWRA
ncbi:MAG: potassium transporter TrkG [Spirochaetia bacterium]|jgi:trk system potassium uptake protein TrkH|nr:potassium transporter TrkG [Spirochaetia bacterium]